MPGDAFLFAGNNADCTAVAAVPAHSSSITMPLIRNIITIFLLSLTSFTASGQEFGTHWIQCPTATSRQGVLFRKMTVGKETPDFAFLEVASAGYVDVYVNERNIDRYCPVVSNTAPITVRRYDVTPYLRPDTNVVAVEYFPRDTMANGRQLSVSVWGKNDDGMPISLQTDDSWLCMPSQRRLLNSDEELQDATAYTDGWKSTVFAQALWTRAAAFTGDKTEDMELISEYNLPYRPCFIIDYNHFDEDKQSTWYDFGTAIYGYFRVTLRGPRRGDVLHIGPLTYICNGNLDEQAFTKFIPRTIRRLKAWGEGGYNREWIQFFQAIGVGPQQ